MKTAHNKKGGNKKDAAYDRAWNKMYNKMYPAMEASIEFTGGNFWKIGYLLGLMWAQNGMTHKQVQLVISGFKEGIKVQE